MGPSGSYADFTFKLPPPSFGNEEACVEVKKLGIFSVNLKETLFWMLDDSFHSYSVTIYQFRSLDYLVTKLKVGEHGRIGSVQNAVLWLTRTSFNLAFCP